MLWLTREDGYSDVPVAILWTGERPRLVKGVGWFGDDVVSAISADVSDIGPGECTPLYTQQQMRERVAKAIDRVGVMPFNDRACDYLSNPTDSNWHALAKAAGIESEAT